MRRSTTLTIAGENFDFGIEIVNTALSDADEMSESNILMERKSDEST